MARGAGCAGLLAVLRMAGDATDPFVDADARAVVTRANLHGGDGRVAVVAERLALVFAHADGTRAVQDGRHGQIGYRHVLLRAAIEQGEKYYWHNGEAVLFDDTFLHDAANQSDSVRVVLFLDVARKMNWRLSLLNRLFLWIAHRDKSVREIRANATVRAKS